MIDRLPDREVPPMARKAQLSLDHASDLWLSTLALKGRAPATRRKYTETLHPFCEAHEHLLPGEVTIDHLRAFLGRWSDHAASTLALHVTVLTGLFGFLYDEGIIPRNPAERLQRPRRPKPEDIEVVLVTDDDIRRMFNAVRTWQELLCLSVLAYLGVRRLAASKVRRRHVDLERGTITFHEKGGKTITKPIPDELVDILRAADTDGVWSSPDAYLIPNRRPSMVRARGERGHKVIYETVVKIADRAGVRAHPHSIRAAFAVAFDEAHPDALISLKELLGHSRIETTMTYLRRKNKQKAMEPVRDLSWGSVFPANPVIPPAGFEPALPANTVGDSDRTVVDADHAVQALLARVRQLTDDAKARGRV
jgi:integrase/recombinase XerD